MRQFGSVPPVLSAAQPPAVSAVTGLGHRRRAGVNSKGSPSDGQGFGTIEIVAGNDAATGGSVTLIFPQLPPLLFIAATDAFGTLTAPNNDGAHTTITINWTARLAGGRHAIHYEWASSK